MHLTHRCGDDNRCIHRPVCAGNSIGLRFNGYIVNVTGGGGGISNVMCVGDLIVVIVVNSAWHAIADDLCCCCFVKL